MPLLEKIDNFANNRIVQYKRIELKEGLNVRFITSYTNV